MKEPIQMHSPITIPPSDIITRVVAVGFREKTGTAFLIVVDDVEYLISARHIFEEEINGEQELVIEEEDEIQIRKNDAWITAPVSVITCDVSTFDIIAFRIPPRSKELQGEFTLKLGSENLFFGQYIFYLGYPYSHYHHARGANQGFAVAWVKGGIVSGIETNAIFIDGHNNPGFSGGPVVYERIDTHELYIMGVVSGFIKDKKKDPILTELINENSGLFLVTPIKFILDAIRQSHIPHS